LLRGIDFAKKYTYMNIGTKIKKLREGCNMSQKDLAFEIDISQGAFVQNRKRNS
jgi:DNA-binding XRE family transcriptional regulator